MTRDAAIAWLASIGAKLDAQDNAYTAHPIFVVQQRRRDYGIDTDYTEQVAWLHEDESVECDADLSKELEAEYQDSYRERSGYRRVGYSERDEFVMAFLTREAAEQFIERQRHNLKHPHVFVDSGYRNQEWIDLRAALKTLAVEVSA